MAIGETVPYGKLNVPDTLILLSYGKSVLTIKTMCFGLTNRDNLLRWAQKENVKKRWV